MLEESRLAALETRYDASLRANRHEEIIGVYDRARRQAALLRMLNDSGARQRIS